MRFNRRMSMNMSVSNKSIGVKQIDKNYNNGEAVGAFRDVKRMFILLKLQINLYTNLRLMV